MDFLLKPNRYGKKYGKIVIYDFEKKAGMSLEDISVGKTALIVWDMQFSLLGKVPNSADVIRNAAQVIEAARAKELPIIYSQSTGLPYEYQTAYKRYLDKRKRVDSKKISNLEGSAEWQIVPEVAPSPNDIVLKKHTGSFFIGTPLNMLLQNKGIQALILMGVITEQGIETTARDASILGYIPIIVEQAVGSGNRESHEISLKRMREAYEVQSTENVIRWIKTK